MANHRRCTESAIRMYVNGSSIPDIASAFRCSLNTVYRTLRDHHICLRPGHEKPLPVDEIVRAYHAGNSIQQIASTFRVGRATIKRRLAAVGTKMRVTTNTRGHIWLPTQRALEIIDGLLLGDGCIHKISCANTAYLSLSQAEGRLGWLQSTCADLTHEGLTSHILGPYPGRDRIICGKPAHGKPYNVLNTFFCTALADVRRRWYPEGKKIVPRDLILTPLVVAHWLAGDGWGDQRGGLGFATDDFFEADVDFLLTRLRCDLNIYAIKLQHRREAWHIGVLRVREGQRLADMVTSLLPLCIRYKTERTRTLLPLNVRYAKHRKRSADQARDIRRLYVQGLSYQEIAGRLNVPQYSIYPIVAYKTHREPDAWPEDIDKNPASLVRKQGNRKA